MNQCNGAETQRNRAVGQIASDRSTQRTHGGNTLRERMRRNAHFFLLDRGNHELAVAHAGSANMHTDHSAVHTDSTTGTD